LLFHEKKQHLGGWDYEARTQPTTDRQGLNDLCGEWLEINLSKQESSDWAASGLPRAQLEYAAFDVLYLRRLRALFELARDRMAEVAAACFAFLLALSQVRSSWLGGQHIFRLFLGASRRTPALLLEYGRGRYAPIAAV